MVAEDVHSLLTAKTNFTSFVTGDTGLLKSLEQNNMEWIAYDNYSSKMIDYYILGMKHIILECSKAMWHATI
eukprot:scaffold240015_cov102-Attheya_sp.AAC.3